MQVLRTTGLSMLIVTAVACGGDGESGGEAASTPPTTSTTIDLPVDSPYFTGSLRFDWPSDCVVPVSEAASAWGRTADLRYGVRLTEEGAGLFVEIVDLEVLAFNGSGVPPDFADEASAYFGMADLLVGPSGELVEVRGAAEVAAEITEAEARLGVPAEASVAEILGDDLVPLLEFNARHGVWEAWAGLWVEWGSIRALEETITVDRRFGIGSPDLPVVFESRGRRNELVKLRATTEVDDLSLDWFRYLYELNTGIRLPDEVTGSGSVTVTGAANPATLRPAEVEIRSDVDLTDGTNREVVVETRSYRFDWDAAGCTSTD